MSCLFPVKSHAAVKKTIIENLDKCSKAEKVKNDFPQMIHQYYPIHKQRWFGGYNKVRRENNPQSPISSKMISKAVDKLDAGCWLLVSTR
jgi:hypothetical protein